MDDPVTRPPLPRRLRSLDEFRAPAWHRRPPPDRLFPLALAAVIVAGVAIGLIV